METNKARIVAASTLGVAGGAAEAVRLLRGVLDVLTQKFEPEHGNTVNCASNLAGSLMQFGEHAETAVLMRTTLPAQTCMLGAEIRARPS